ncbi:hypothetical protein O3P69_009221 [Scylla paramamosain]|uniref:RING-type domain-containing protein n=2 Tax=Scylla paramamosain TaxID=85552 RepID=A0AAW0T9Z8_SCYPA
MNNYTECYVCSSIYSKDEDHRPRIFPCGHSCCTSCVTSLLDQGTEGHLTCPKCRIQHAAPNATPFPFNYDMEGLIQQISQEEQQDDSEITENQEEEAGEPGKAEFIALWESVVDLHFKFNTVTAQIEQAKSNTSQAKHQSLKNQLGEMMADNNEAIRKKAEAEAKYQGLLDESHTIASHLAAVANQLENSVSGREKRAILNVAYSQIREMKRWMKRSEETVASDTTATFSNTVLMSTQGRIKHMAENFGDGEGGACDGGGAGGDVTSSQVAALLEKVQHSLEQLVTYSFMLTAEDLRTMNVDVRGLLEGRKVFGLYQELGVPRCAYLTLENGWLHLYHLRYHPPPYEAHTVQVARYLSPTFSSRLVFLDLAWQGKVQGRVYIHLKMHLPMARQFLMLCSGQLGPSYAGTSLLVMYSQRLWWDYVVGGDYDFNDGSGGAALLRYLDTNDSEPIVPGSVWGRYVSENRRAAQFAISVVSKDRNEDIFGNVDEGLDVLRAALVAMDKYTVNVKECGVVIKP